MGGEDSYSMKERLRQFCRSQMFDNELCPVTQITLGKTLVRDHAGRNRVRRRRYAAGGRS